MNDGVYVFSLRQCSVVTDSRARSGYVVVVSAGPSTARCTIPVNPLPANLDRAEVVAATSRSANEASNEFTPAARNIQYQSEDRLTRWPKHHL